MALAVALVASGCASSPEVAAPDTTIAAEPGPVVVGLRASAKGLVDRWGDEGAFFVVLAALDRGYLVGQITEALDAGTLHADGTVSGVDPAGEASNLLTTVAAGWRSGVSAPDDAPQDAFVAFVDQSASDLFAAGRRQIAAQQVEELMVGILLHLAARGYSLEQIVNGIVLGQITIEAPTLGCWLLTDGGAPVVAARPQVEGIPCPPPGSVGAATTTSVARPATPGGSDGMYVGGITDWPSGWDLRDSTVTAQVSGTRVVLEVEYLASIPFRHTEGVLVCTLVVNVLAAGSGELAAEFALTVESAGVLDASGSECGDTFPWPRSAADEFVGNMSGATLPVQVLVETDALLGMVLLPFLEFEAVRP